MPYSESPDWVRRKSMCKECKPCLLGRALLPLSADQRQCTFKCDFEALYLGIKGVGMKTSERGLGLSPSCGHCRTAVVVVQISQQSTGQLWQKI